MKSLFVNIKNLLPYFFLIAIYFFFVNIEAKNDRSKINNELKNIEKINELQSDKNSQNIKIEIPVIPYEP